MVFGAPGSAFHIPMMLLHGLSLNALKYRAAAQPLLAVTDEQVSERRAPAFVTSTIGAVQMFGPKAVRS
jgi:hypothetical protein